MCQEKTIVDSLGFDQMENLKAMSIEFLYPKGSVVFGWAAIN